MTPKEKAVDLVRMYRGFNNETPEINHNTSVQCACIAVDEILQINSVDKDYYLSDYWEEVKQELEKL